jgi:hypothetical protein
MNTSKSCHPSNRTFVKRKYKFVQRGRRAVQVHGPIFRQYHMPAGLAVSILVSLSLPTSCQLKNSQISLKRSDSRRYAQIAIFRLLKPLKKYRSKSSGCQIILCLRSHSPRSAMQRSSCSERPQTKSRAQGWQPNGQLGKKHPLSPDGTIPRPG